MELFSLEGKRALITGSSRGLGLAMARGLGEAGASLVLNGRDEDALKEAEATLRAEGLEVTSYAFDVTDENQVDGSVDQIETDEGSIDVLFNNAGVNLRGPLEEFETEVWAAVMNLNVNAVFYMSRAVGRYMLRRGKGKIVNVCSLMSERGRAQVTPYATSKGALKMMTRSLAVEWGGRGIQVNAIGPGYFATEMTRPLWEDEKFDAWVCEKTPVARWGDPTELVGAAVFLSSRASDFVTGQTIYVDGGWLANI